MTARETLRGPYVHRREQFRSDATCIFVDPFEFRRLAVSMRRLVRADAPEAGLKGLLDEATGERYVTEEEKLFSA
jgi:hypothetical protein